VGISTIPRYFLDRGKGILCFHPFQSSLIETHLYYHNMKRKRLIFQTISQKQLLFCERTGFRKHIQTVIGKSFVRIYGRGKGLEFLKID